MSLGQLFILGAASLGIGVWGNRYKRDLLILAASVLVVFWLQPASPIRNLGFWLSFATVALPIFTYVILFRGNKELIRSNAKTVVILGGMVLLIGGLRYFGDVCCITPTIPPRIFQILLATAVLSGIMYGVYKTKPDKSILLGGMLLVLVIAFALIKNPKLSTLLSGMLRSFSGQNTALAGVGDIVWIGYSYIAFRLIHTIRDKQKGILKDVSLAEFLSYVLFFPSFLAGPIDRIQHFAEESRAKNKLDVPRLVAAGERLAVGIFKKFVVADSLALLSLHANSAGQLESTGWTWVLLYGYAFRIFFDFAGYTDIAIGLGILMGIQLPENFNRPYRNITLTTFWNNWHMTLTQWFRGYVFNPLSRAMRKSKIKLSMPLMVLIGQLVTMVLIGLWHGITWNFVIWGAWHGIGLFIDNRWTSWSRPKSKSISENKPKIYRLYEIGSWLVTFHYVVIGWIWFVMPTPQEGWQVLMILLGVGHG